MDSGPFWIASVSALGVIGASLIAWKSNREGLLAAQGREHSLETQLAQQRDDDRCERELERKHARALTEMDHELQLERLARDQAGAERAETLRLRREAHLDAMTWLIAGQGLLGDIEKPDAVEEAEMTGMHRELKSVRSPLELHAGEPSIEAFNAAVDQLQAVWFAWRHYRVGVLGRHDDEGELRRSLTDARLTMADAARRYRQAARQDLE